MHFKTLGVLHVSFNHLKAILFKIYNHQFALKLNIYSGTISQPV